MRRIKADSLLVGLPGVTWENKKEGVLKVNLKTAKYLAKPIFHLLGYRSKHTDKTHIRLFNRERVAKTNSYKRTAWF